MAETTTVARPYAQAVFKLAREAGDFRRWSDMLTVAAQVASDPTMLALIESPRAEHTQLARLFADVCGERLDDRARNLLKLLAQNGRLALLPVIAELYEQMRADAEGSVEAELIAAMDVDAAAQDKIAQALKARLNRDVTLTFKVDPALLGGAVIRAGDLVIDGSVRGRLQKLASALI
jgi:F-type H+-transporting ATPase subunit delta